MIVWNEETDALIKRRYIDEDVPATSVAKELGEGATAAGVRSRAARCGWSKVGHPKGKPPPPPTAAAEPRKPTWLPPVKAEKPGPRAATLADLPDFACRWPVGKDPGPGLMYLHLMCGEPAIKDQPYCATHDEKSRPKGG